MVLQVVLKGARAIPSNIWSCVSGPSIAGETIFLQEYVVGGHIILGTEPEALTVLQSFELSSCP